MEEINSFFSIIVPIYNAEKTLAKTVDHILKQSFENFQVLLIDDCSTDSSQELCKKYEELDSRVEVYQTAKNGGVAVARNEGLKHVKGKYVSFCDSDDYIELDLLETIYPYLKNGELDCIKYGCIEEYIELDTQKQYSKRITTDTSYYNDRNEILKKIVDLELIPLFGYTCNCFYKTQIIKDYDLWVNEQYKLIDDVEFNLRFFQYVNKFQCLNYCGYHYTKILKSNSLSSQYVEEYYDLYLIKFNMFVDLFGGIEQVDPESMQKLLWLYVRTVYSSLERMKNNDDKMQQFFNELANDKWFNYLKNFSFKHLSFKQKAMINLLLNYENGHLGAFIRGIGIVKNRFPFLFARIKG